MAESTQAPLPLKNFFSNPAPTYTSQYCEENVYLLCARLAETPGLLGEGADAYAVFVSSAVQAVS